MREHAIYLLAEQEAIDILIGLYDDVQSEPLRDKILYWLAQSGKKPALEKLYQVAKSSTSRRQREQAVTLLGQSRTADAIRLLEQILK